MTSSDVEERSLDGDVGAFGELIRQWDRDLRAVVWVVVRSADATDRIMQSSYAQAFRNLERFDRSASLKTWLHAVCLRSAIASARRASQSDDGDTLVPSWSTVAADREDDHEVASTELGQRFDSLGRVDQMLLMLTSGLGYSFDETGTIVGMDSDTVASKVSRSRVELRPAMTSGTGHEELRAHLRSRVPEPAAGYWSSVDARLQVVAGELSDGPSPDPNASAGRVADEGSTRTGTEAAAVIEPPSVGESSDVLPEDEPWWRNGRMLAAAAGIVLVLGLGALALSNRSSDDLVSTATGTGQEVTDAEGGASGSSDALADTATGVFAEGPLTAIQARLTGVAGQGGASAGPFCFASSDAVVYPANELIDRRALVRIEISSDGFVDYYALQGDSILISGSGAASQTGLVTTELLPLVGASGAVPTDITITDSTVQFGPGGAVIGLVACSTVQDRVDQLFLLLEGSSFVDNGVDWPPADAVLSSAGLGPIRVGMSVSELSAQLGTELEIATINIANAGECGWIADSGAISNAVWIIVELTSAADGTIRRVSVSDPRWSTPSGAMVGMTEQQILDIFPGQIESTPHLYVEGSYLTYQPANASDPNTVQFVNEGGVIAQMHAGDKAWVGLVEGCA